jgi:hypothetical protein
MGGKNMKTGNLAIAFVLLALVAGAALGVAINEVRTEVVEVEKLVEVEVPVEIEVEKDFDAYKQLAVDLCYDEFVEYIKPDKYEELILFDVSDEWNIVFDGNKTISIDELKFIKFDTLTEARNPYTRNCTVFLEDGEDAEITLA